VYKLFIVNLKKNITLAKSVLMAYLCMF